MTNVITKYKTTSFLKHINLFGIKFTVYPFRANRAMNSNESYLIFLNNRNSSSPNEGEAEKLGTAAA